MKTVLLVHGPNLNLLGEREPEIYGTMTLKELVQMFRNAAEEQGVKVQAFQSNCEGELIDFLHRKRKVADGVVINPGALSHYSYALRDAISAILLPTVEVHLSNIKMRERFRRHSVVEEVCVAQFSGEGTESYIKGLNALLAIIDRNKHTVSPARKGSRVSLKGGKRKGTQRK